MIKKHTDFLKVSDFPDNTEYYTYDDSNNLVKYNNDAMQTIKIYDDNSQLKEHHYYVITPSRTHDKKGKISTIPHTKLEHV